MNQWLILDVTHIIRINFKISSKVHHINVPEHKGYSFIAEMTLVYSWIPKAQMLPLIVIAHRENNIQRPSANLPGLSSFRVPGEAEGSASLCSGVLGRKATKH